MTDWNTPIFRTLREIKPGETYFVFDHVRKVVIPIEGAAKLLVSPEEAYALLRKAEASVAMSRVLKAGESKN